MILQMLEKSKNPLDGLIYKDPDFLSQKVIVGAMMIIFIMVSINACFLFFYTKKIRDRFDTTIIHVVHINNSIQAIRDAITTAERHIRELQEQIIQNPEININELNANVNKLVHIEEQKDKL